MFDNAQARVVNDDIANAMWLSKKRDPEKQTFYHIETYIDSNAPSFRKCAYLLTMASR
jgi:hypothetical protein